MASQDIYRRGPRFTLPYDKAAGVALKKGQEVSLSVDSGTVNVAADANTGIGVSAADYAATWTDKVEIDMFGSKVELLTSNGTVTMSTRIVSAGNGKFTNAGATPDGRQVRGIALMTSVVDGALFPALLP